MIISLIKEYLSPEQVSGYLKKHHDISISHETIYRHVFGTPSLKAELKPYFRQGKNHRRKRYGSGARASNIPNRVPLSERPAEVDEKNRIGDWECDTVIGKDKKSVLVTLVERNTLFTLCKKIPSKTTDKIKATDIFFIVNPS